MFRILLAFVLGVATLPAQPVGYVEVTTDRVPARVYFDSRLVVLAEGENRVVDAAPGKHFVSLFEPRKVHLAFKDDAPPLFWDELRKDVELGDEYSLLSSYERGAVRAGTEWVYVVPGDTIPVRLSQARADAEYNKDSSGVLSTFVLTTGLIGVAMVLSIVFARLD